MSLFFSSIFPFLLIFFSFCFIFSGNFFNFCFCFPSNRLVCEYEHYVPLCLPVPDTIDAVTDILQTFSKKHFLSGLLLKEVTAHISVNERNIRLRVREKHLSLTITITIIITITITTTCTLRVIVYVICCIVVSSSLIAVVVKGYGC